MQKLHTKIRFAITTSDTVAKTDLNIGACLKCAYTQHALLDILRPYISEGISKLPFMPINALREACKYHTHIALNKYVVDAVNSEFVFWFIKRSANICKVCEKSLWAFLRHYIAGLSAYYALNGKIYGTKINGRV